MEGENELGGEVLMRTFNKEFKGVGEVFCLINFANLGVAADLAAENDGLGVL